MPKGYSIETVRQVWNDDTGERVEIGPDRDGLDLIEIRQVTDDGVTTATVTLTREQLEKLQKCIELTLSGS